MHNEVSSELFNLIHSMNKGEKRYFKLYARARSPHIHIMHYMRLFDVIEKQKKYDEEKIVRKGIVKKERLRALKHYLHNLILESLLALRRKGNDIDSKLSNMLEFARIMEDKGLRGEEIKFLKRTKELALQNERWEMAMEALRREIRIIRERQDVKQQQGLEKEMEMLLNKLNNLMQYIRINREVFTLLQKSGIQRTAENQALKTMLRHPLLSDKEKAVSTEAKRIYFNTHIHYYFFKRDFQKAEPFIIQLIHLIESSNSTFDSLKLPYSSALNLLAIAQCQLGKYAEALSTIHKHRFLLSKSESVKAHVFICSYLNETNYYLLTKEFEKGAAIIKDIEKELYTFKSGIPDAGIIALYNNFALLYFGAGDYHKSLAWINKVINHPKIIFREDLQAWSRILQLLIHYELNTPDIVQHLNISTNRFLHKKKLLYKVENGLLNFIRRLSKIDRDHAETGASKKARMEEFCRFRDEIIQLIKDPNEKKALDYFDLISWLESKIKNKSFAEIIRQKADPSSGG